MPLNKKKAITELADLDELVKQTDEREQKLASADPIHLDKTDLYHANAKPTKPKQSTIDTEKEHGHHATPAPVKLAKASHDKHGSKEKPHQSISSSVHEPKSSKDKSKSDPQSQTHHSDKDSAHSHHPDPGHTAGGHTESHSHALAEGPGHPAAVPGHPSETSGHPSGTPGHTSGTTGHTSGTTGHTSGTPGHTSATTGHPSATTGHPTGTPGHTSATTGHPPGTPGHTSATPGHTSATTGHPPGTPGHTSATTGHPPGTPDHISATPGHTSATTGHLPATPGHPPGTPGHPPGTPGHPPGTPGHPPGTPDHAGDKNANPVLRKPLPEDEDEEFIKITPQSHTNMPFSSSTDIDNKGMPLLIQTHTDDLIKTVYPPHIILLRKYGLLFVLYITTALSGVGFILWTYHQHILGAPPTVFSQEAYFNSMCSVITLFISSIISIIILRAKVHHLAFGYFVMFLFVVTLYFTMGGVSRAYLSLKFDDVITIEKYIFRNDTRSEGQLPTFFQRIQTKFKCCGSSNIDKMEDWPMRLGTIDMPESCCRLPKYNCGAKLGRTYTYTGSNRSPMRMPSGFFLTLAETEMNELIKAGKPMKIIKPGKDSVETVLQILGKFYFKVLKESYVPGTDVKNMRRIENSLIYPINITEDMKPMSLACQDDAAFDKTTMIGWEIQRLIDKETSRLHQKTDPISYHWMAWKIPICNEIAGRPPYYLAANLNRDLGMTTQTEIRHLWYISRGITENFILKDKLWDLYCETENNFRLIRLKTHHHQRTFSDEKYQVIGTFFLAFVQQLMLLCIGVSILVAICLLIVFLIFWNYYTKMRLEEFANLPYPPEFDGLEVRQSDLYIKHNKSEYVKGAHKIARPSEFVGANVKKNKVVPATQYDENQVSPQLSQNHGFLNQANLISSKPRGSEMFPDMNPRASSFASLPDVTKGQLKGATENLAKPIVQKSTPQQGVGTDNMKNNSTVSNPSTQGQGSTKLVPPKPAAVTPTLAPNSGPAAANKSLAPPAPSNKAAPKAETELQNSNKPFEFSQDDLDMFEAAEAGNFDPNTIIDDD